METLFENRYVRTKEHVKEMYRYILFTGPSALMAYILTVVLLAINIALMAVENDGDYFFNFLILAVIVMFPVTRVVNYIKIVNFTLDRDMELNNGSPAYLSLDVYDDVFNFTSTSGTRTDVSFLQLKIVRCTKNLILLSTDANICYVFPKDTFTKGSAIGFMEFLKSKGFKVK